jgi:DnaK suppressor protein
MYNPGLFSVRQEPRMPAKKSVTKKRKKTTATKKKVAAKKTTARKKAAPKRKVSKKAAPKRKVSKKKAAPKRKVSKKKAASKKKVAKKKVSKKKVTKKKVAKKKVSKKKPSKKPASKKKVAKKKSASKKKVSRKKAVAKPVITRKRATTKRVAKTVHKAKPAPSRARSKGDVLSGPIHGIAPYKPKRGEEYMSDAQLKHFHNILSAWKRELMFEVDRTVHHMQDEAANFPDPNDRATQESEFGLELRTRDRERKLLRKIDQALARIDEGSYGFCDETGEEIGLKRLEARPVATLCLEAQERRELAERQFRDRDDRYR